MRDEDDACIRRVVVALAEDGGELPAKPGGAGVRGVPLDANDLRRVLPRLHLSQPTAADPSGDITARTAGGDVGDEATE